MGNTYTRQSSYSDGDVITAAHTNDEFNQLLAAFQASSGHTHDGTANEGGPITKMLGTSLTLGDGTAGTDITVTFDGETSDGVLKWMEDEDYFEFSDDILVASTEKLQFRDTAIYINSSTDGQLDLVADTEIQIAATTIDMNGALDLSGNLTTTGLITGGSLDIDDVVINGSTIGHTDDTDLITVANGIVTVAGEISVTTLDIGGTNVTATATELNLLDGVSGLVQADFTKLAAVDSTATELNIVDGDTSIGTTTVSDGHGIVMNHGGTMAQTTVQTLAAYLDDEITAMPNLVTTAATTVGALNSGSITSGFGTIDTGSSTITTTGLITGGSLDIDDVVINGTTIGHTDDTDLITLADGVVTVAGEVDTVSLDVSGDIDVDGTTNLDNTDIDGTLVVDGSNISLDSTSTLNIDNSNTSNGITIGTATSGVPISIGHGTSEVTVNDNLTVTGNLTINGTTTTVDTTNTTVKDNLLGLNSGASSNSNDVGIIIERGSTGNDALFIWDESEDKFALGTTTDNASSTGNLNMTTGTLVANIEGNLTGTLQTAAQANVTSLGTLTALTVDNVAINGATIGHTDDTDLITLADGIATIAGEVSMTTLDIGGTNVTSTAAELNLMDGGATVGTTAVAGGDGIVTNDGGTMRQTSVDTFDTYLSATTKTLTNKTLTTPIVNAGIQLKNGSTSAGFIEFFEDSDNGTNKVTLIGPASTSDITLTLPSTAGTVATTASAEDTSIALAIALG